MFIKQWFDLQTDCIGVRWLHWNDFSHFGVCTSRIQVSNYLLNMQLNLKLIVFQIMVAILCSIVLFHHTDSVACGKTANAGLQLRIIMPWTVYFPHHWHCYQLFCIANCFSSCWRCKLFVFLATYMFSYLFCFFKQIKWGACYLALAGNVVVYLTMMAYFSFFDQDDSVYGGMS